MFSRTRFHPEFLRRILCRLEPIGLTLKTGSDGSSGIWSSRSGECLWTFSTREMLEQWAAGQGIAPHSPCRE